MSKWCCDWFLRFLGQAGEKGFSIVAFRDLDFRAFYLQARPFEPDVVQYYNAINEKSEQNRWPKLVDPRGIAAPYVIVLQLPLSFCPRCGTDLAQMIRKNLHEFDRLAEEMKCFWVE